MRFSSFLLLAIASLSLVVLEAPTSAVAHPLSDPTYTSLHLVRREESSEGDAGFVNGGEGNGEGEPPPKKKKTATAAPAPADTPAKEPIKTGADKSVKEIAKTFDKQAAPATPAKESIKTGADKGVKDIAKTFDKPVAEDEAPETPKSDKKTKKENKKESKK